MVLSGTILGAQNTALTMCIPSSCIHQELTRNLLLFWSAWRGNVGGGQTVFSQCSLPLGQLVSISDRETSLSCLVDDETARKCL